MRGRTYLPLAMIALLCLGWLAPSAPAQESRGTIVGRVTDQTGAAIPGANVTVTSQAMGTKQAAQTNETGAYQAAYLIPGLYTVEVESTGFKKYVQKDIEVRVNDRIELAVTMEVGGTEQSITVVGETPLLNTTTAQWVKSSMPAGSPIFRCPTATRCF